MAREYPSIYARCAAIYSCLFISIASWTEPRLPTAKVRAHYFNQLIGSVFTLFNKAQANHHVDQLLFCAATSVFLQLGIWKLLPTINSLHLFSRCFLFTWPLPLLPCAVYCSTCMAMLSPLLSLRLLRSSIISSSSVPHSSSSAVLSNHWTMLHTDLMHKFAKRCRCTVVRPSSCLQALAQNDFLTVSPIVTASYHRSLVTNHTWIYSQNYGAT